MSNFKKIMTEWNKAGITVNGFTMGDIQGMYDDLVHNVPDDSEAIKIFILAIRSAAKKGARTQMTVSNNIQRWLLAGLTTAEAVGQYELEQASPRGNYNQPVIRETKVSSPTADDIETQNMTMAKAAGFDSSQEMAQATRSKLDELRASREQRMSERQPVSRTMTGRRVMQRF